MANFEHIQCKKDSQYCHSILVPAHPTSSLPSSISPYEYDLDCRESIFHQCKYCSTISQTNYAEVAEKISMSFPSFRNHRQVEKMALNSPTRPRPIAMPFTRCNTTIAITGRIEASTAPTRLVILMMRESEYSTMSVLNSELLPLDLI